MNSGQSFEEPMLLGEDIVPQRPNRGRQVRIHRRFGRDCFITQANGLIQTVWGEILPSVWDSQIKLRSLRQELGNSPRETVSARILKLVKVDPHTGCWTTELAAHVVSGYIPIHIPHEKKPLDLHRLIFAVDGNELKVGRSWHLDHKCMNKPCCNPLHLAYETAEVNVRLGQRAHKIVNLHEMGQADLFDSDPSST